MTLFAEFAKATIVYVIDIVATDASAVCRYLVWHGLVVAVLASQTFVPTVKSEGGLFVVVKAPGFPRHGVMTGFAAWSKGVPVLVVLLVTADAGSADIFECRR